MAQKYNDLCIDIRRQLIACGDGNPVMTARTLVCAASGKSLEQLLEDYGIYAPAPVIERAMELCARRVAGEPLAYILGSWEFMGMELAVAPGVLIPRDDTEAVASLAIRAAEAMVSAGIEPKVLDLCCGSGCIGLAVAKFVPSARVVMADISQQALNLSHRNAVSLELAGRAIQVMANAMEPPPAFLGKFDILVSNPPYIPSGQIKQLDVSVRDFEPTLALDGGEDGLDFYRSIITQWQQALRPGGRMLFEVGADQAEQVLELMRSQGMGITDIALDSEGIHRAVAAEIM